MIYLKMIHFLNLLENNIIFIKKINENDKILLLFYHKTGILNIIKKYRDYI